MSSTADSGRDGAPTTHVKSTTLAASHEGTQTCRTHPQDSAPAPTDQTMEGNARVELNHVSRSAQTDSDLAADEECGESDAAATIVRVFLLKTVCFPPHQCVLEHAAMESLPGTGPVAFESASRIEQEYGVFAKDSLIEPHDHGEFQIPLTNPNGITCVLQAGEMLGEATEATVVQPEESEASEVKIIGASENPASVQRWEKQRQEKLKETVGDVDLPDEEKEAFQALLARHHRAFCLEEGERGEMDLIRMEIDTGGAHSRKQRVPRLPFALRQVVAKQLGDMQRQGVI